MRKNINEIISNSELDIEYEYTQLYKQFYSLQSIVTLSTSPKYSISNNYSAHLLAILKFKTFPKDFRKRSIDLQNYNKHYGFDFQDTLNKIDSDYLILFCEYIVNICNQIDNKEEPLIKRSSLDPLINNSVELMDEFGFKLISKDEIYYFTEKKKEALAVAEIVDDNLSYTVLEYNHHTMKGDLKKKKATLLLLANDIEHQSKKLKEINKDLQTKLFGLLNNFIRHDCDYYEYIKTLSKEELEEIYDDTYQIWLLAKLELDNVERKKRIEKVFNSLKHN